MRIILSLLFCLLSLCLFSQNRQGKDRALFFAVNTYDKMTDLNNPIKNARDIAAELEKSYGFEIEIVSNPTSLEIENKIIAYKEQYRKGRYASSGQLFIFFSGHGVKQGNNGYFMPKDGDPDRPHRTAIEYDYWRSKIDEINCKHILVAIDACHSATFDPNWKNRSGFARPGEQNADRVIINFDAYKARLFFTSDAVGDETPDRSTFARQFLTGLRNKIFGIDYMTSDELYGSYLKKAAPLAGGGSFGTDEPGSTFLFFQKPAINFSDVRSDRDAWQDALQQNSIAAYQRYLRQYPNGDFRPLANQKLTQLQREEQELLDWNTAKLKNTPSAFQAFIQKYPGSIYKDLAELKIIEAKPAEITSPRYH